MFSLLSSTVAVLLVVGVVAALYLRKHRTLAKCSTCGALSQFGYSRQAESSAGDIARLCLGCLMAKLTGGFRGSTLDRVFSEGPSQTLLQWGNARPYSVCGKCCPALIQKAIESRGLTFLEVCGPGSENGVILPMGY